MGFLIKIKSEEHSKAVQERLFQLGYKWNSSEKKYLKDVWYYHESDAVIYIKNSRTLEYSHLDYYSISRPTTPFKTLDDLYEMELPKVCKIESLEYEIVSKNDGFKVGCQTITKEDAKIIANFFLENIKE